MNDKKMLNSKYGKLLKYYGGVQTVAFYVMVFMGLVTCFGWLMTIPFAVGSWPVEKLLMVACAVYVFTFLTNLVLAVLATNDMDDQ